MATTALSPGTNLPPTGIPLVDSGFTIIAQSFALAQSDISNALDTAAAGGGVGTVPTNPPVPSSISVRVGTDGSMDVSLGWNYTNGTIPADFMIVFWKQGTAALAAPTSADKAILLAPTATTFTFLGLDPASNYRFGIGAARKDSAGTAVAVGTIIAPDGSAGPDWADINTTGNYQGPINSIPASTVTANAANGQTSFTGTTNYRTAGAPTNLPAPASLFAGIDTDASARYTLQWNYTQGALKCDGFIVFVKEADTTSFVASDPHFELAAQSGAGPLTTSFTVKGYPSDRVLSFAVAAFRRTENALEIGAPVTSSSGPDWTGISSGTPSYAGTIYGVDQHSFSARAVGQSATVGSVWLRKDGADLVWTGRDPEFLGIVGPHSSLGLSYNLTIYDLVGKAAIYQHCYDCYDFSTLSTAADGLVTGTAAAGGVVASGAAGKWGNGPQFVATAGQRAWLVSGGTTNLYATLQWAECWIKMSGNPASAGCIMGCSQNADGSGFNLSILRLNTNGTVSGRAWDGAAARTVTSTATVTDGAWHHVAVAATAGNLHVWVDGIRTQLTVGTLTGLTMGAPGSTLYLAAGYVLEAGQLFNSPTIDEIIVSDNSTFRVNQANFTPPTTEFADYTALVGRHAVWHLQELWLTVAYANSQRPQRALTTMLKSYSDYQASTGNSARYLFIIQACHEPQQNRLLDGLPDQLAAIGARRALFSASTFQQGSAYLLVGQPQKGEGNGMEYYAGAIANDPNAMVEASWQTQGVNIVGTGGAGWDQADIPGPPTNNITPTNVAVVVRSVGVEEIVITWTYTQPSLSGDNKLADGFAIYVQGGNTATPATGATATFYVPADARNFNVPAPFGQLWSFAVASYRRTANGMETAAPITSAAAPDWQGIGGSTQVQTAGITDANVTTPKVADNNITTPKRQLVNTQSGGTASLSANTGSNPVNFFAGSANIVFTHGLGRTAISTSSSSNSSAVGCWPANGATNIVVTAQNFSTAVQTTTLTCDYW